MLSQFRLSVGLSVRQTRGSIKNGASQDYQMFNVSSREDSSFRIRILQNLLINLKGITLSEKR